MAAKKATEISMRFRASEVESKLEGEAIVTRCKLGALTILGDDGEQTVAENAVLGTGQARGLVEFVLHDAGAAALMVAGEDYRITVTPA